MAVKNKAEQKKDYIYDYIEGSKLYWNQGIKTCHKGLERVNAKECMLEKPYCNPADKNTDGAHEAPLYKMILVENIHCMLLVIPNHIRNLCHLVTETPNPFQDDNYL